MDKKTTERKKLLQDTINVVCGERQDQYGSVEDCFSKIAELWSVYLDEFISPRDVAHMMVLLKVARNMIKTSYCRDNWVDIAGYAACGAEVDKPCQ